MTVELVTVAQVDRALRLDLEGDLSDLSDYEGDTDRLEDIQLKINQATDIVLDYLKLDQEYVVWTSSDVPGSVSASIILVVKSLYDDSAMAEMLKGIGAGDLTNPVVALLHRLRDPAIA